MTDSPETFDHEPRMFNVATGIVCRPTSSRWCCQGHAELAARRYTAARRGAYVYVSGARDVQFHAMHRGHDLLYRDRETDVWAAELPIEDGQSVEDACAANGFAVTETWADGDTWTVRQLRPL